MIDIRGDNQYIDIDISSEWDSNLNNYAGGNKAVINIKGGYQLTQLKTDFDDLKFEVEELVRKNKELEKAVNDDIELRNENE